MKKDEKNYWLSPRRLARRRLLAGAAVGAVGIASASLVGCGDDDDDEETTGTATPGGEAIDYPEAPRYSDLDPQDLLSQFHWSRVAPQSQVLGTPRSGGVAVFPTASFGTTSLHPTDQAAGQWPYCYTHNNLLGMDFRHESLAVDTQPLTVRNSVSLNWEQPDDVTYTFELNPDVRWHNVAPGNGDALTIDDIRATYELFKASPFHALKFATLESIEEPEPGTVQIKMSAPTQAIINVLRIPAFGILNARHIDEGDDALAEKAIGTGPFTQGKFVPNTVRIYEKNPEYWLNDDLGNQLPYMDAVVHTVIADPAAAVAAFRAGQVDYYKPTSAEEFNRLRGEIDVWAQVGPGFCGCATPSVRINYREDTFNDVRVRRALSMALDRQDMIDTIFGGAATMRSFLPWMWAGLAWPKTIEELGEWNAYNPSEAMSLLESAGGPPPKFDLGFVGQVLPGTGAATGDPLIESIVRDFGEIGVEVKLVPYDNPGAGAAFYGKQWSGLFRGSAGSATALGSDDFFEFLRNGSGLNGGDIDDPDLEAMLERARGTFNDEELTQLNQEIDQYVSEDQITYGLRLPDTFAFEMWRKHLHNVVDTPNWWISGGGGQMVTEAWLDEDAPTRDVSEF